MLEEGAMTCAPSIGDPIVNSAQSWLVVAGLLFTLGIGVVLIWRILTEGRPRHLPVKSGDRCAACDHEYSQ